LNTPNAHYDVVEGRVLASSVDTTQLVAVGRSNAGVHLTLSPAAAIALAKILGSFAAMQKALLNTGLRISSTAPIVDSDLWTHIAIDLEAQKSLHAVRDTVGDLAVEVGVMKPTGLEAVQS